MRTQLITLAVTMTALTGYYLAIVLRYWMDNRALYDMRDKADMKRNG